MSELHSLGAVPRTLGSLGPSRSRIRSRKNVVPSVGRGTCVPRHDVGPHDGAPRARACAELTDAEVESFKALGAEVRLATRDSGDVWVVPEYTGSTERLELSVDALRVVTRVSEMLPVADVRVQRKPRATEPRSLSEHVAPQCHEALEAHRVALRAGC